MWGKKQPEKETVLQVEGMMCAHCKARVEAALTAVKGVRAAVADPTAGTATVTAAADVTAAALITAIEAAGYKACV